MEVDELKPTNIDENKLNEIISFLISNKTIYFKNQSREETDLTDNEKSDIAKQIYFKSKLNFLSRFGKYLTQDQLDYFKTFSDNYEEAQDIKMILDNLSRFHSECDYKLNAKNRRYEALNKMITENSYFSENEMMKRNPLLYEQLVGQYLSKDEKKERDRNVKKDTLVKILLEGIERDIAEDIFQKQLEDEQYDASINEEDADLNESSTEEQFGDINETESFKSFKWGEFHDEPSCSYTSSLSSSKWGEMSVATKPKRSTTTIKNPIQKKKAILQKDSRFITAEERRLLKEEFTTIMHQNFLNGKDDFDYTTIDNNDEYDNIAILEHDEEDKYFDAEEPDEIKMEDDQSKAVSESSEDELDMYMNALNQHPTVLQLSKDLEKM